MANLSADTDQEYFADGMTDLLITQLGQIAALQVISRTSAMQLKGVKKPLPEIAKQLGVDAVVTGSVMRSGGRVRINAELVDGATDNQLWSKIYQRELTDVLTLQGEVAQAIATEIRAKVTPQEAGRLSRVHTIAPAALDAYLRGRYYWSLYEPEPLVKSVESYEEPVRLDPSYADAFAGMAMSLTGLHYVGAQPFEEIILKARETE